MTEEVWMFLGSPLDSLGRAEREGGNFVVDSAKTCQS